MPHVAVDARMLGHSGIGTYLRNLLPAVVALRPDWRWTLLGDPAALQALPWADGAKVATRECRAPIYSIREQVEIGVKRPRRIDLFWSPHYNVPLAHFGPLMVTLHDIGHLTLPQFFPGLAQRAYARTMFGAVRRRARAIVCDSAFTRGEYLRLVGAGPADPRVVYPGIDTVWSEPHAPTSPHPRPYLVCVGVMKAHKNVGTLVRAFARIHETIPHDLIIIGRREGMRTVDADAERAAADLGARVHFTGEVAFDVLRSFVEHADALATTSLHEGFGLPPLEAMAAGVPTLVSTAGSLPEVCGDGALYCDPYDANDVAEKLRQILEDVSLRAALKERGRKQAARYTWSACAEQTMQVMENCLTAFSYGVD